MCPSNCPRTPGTPALLLGLLACLVFPAGEGAAGELTPVATGERPDLALPDLAGRDFDLASLRGRVVLVNFWASWCTPCIEEMPSIQRLADALAGSRVYVVGVNVGEGELRAKAVSERLGIRFPLLVDKDSAAFERWGAKVLPTTYVLDGEGVVRYLGLGPLEWDSAEVLELLNRLGTGAPKPDADRVGPSPVSISPDLDTGPPLADGRPGGGGVSIGPVMVCKQAVRSLLVLRNAPPSRRSSGTDWCRA